MRENLPRTNRLPTRAVVDAPEDIVIGRNPDGLWLSWADGHPMNVGICEAAPRLFPGLAAISTAPHPVDFDPCPDRLRIHRVNDQSRDAWDAHRGAFFGQIHGKLVPSL